MCPAADDPQPSAGYSDADHQRWMDEPVRSARSEFARDRARIVHSASLRRLAAKTQVVGPSSDDFIRNRLTHTLEVAQVGRDLATALGADPDIVEAACLAHDLGHPPFGHNGEAALHAAAVDVGGFEGNAQTLRVLTRLEAKAIDPESGESRGLNLTRAVLDASIKYPWTIDEAPQPFGRHGDGLPRAVRKFGVYQDDLPVFAWIRSGVGEELSRQTPIETQIMDVADDVAYSVHDVEDGIVAERIDLTALEDSGLRKEIWLTAQDWYRPDIELDELEAAYERLSVSDGWPTRAYDGSRRELAGLKTLTSRLIGRFCLAVDTVPGRSSGTPIARYAAQLHVPDAVRAEILVLKGIAAHLVMKSDDRVAEHELQRAILSELVEALAQAGPDAFEPAFRADLAVATDAAGRLRVVIDQVASLTDNSAVERHRALVGPA